MFLVRREILETIKNDMILINTTNGYNNTFTAPNIQIGVRPSNSIKSFPHVGIEMGTENAIDQDESGTIIKRNADVYIVVSINTADVDTVETYIEDVKAWLTLNNELLPTISLGSIKFMTGYSLDKISPIIDRVKNYSIVVFTLKCEYWDVIDSYTLTRIITEDGKFIITQN